MHLLINITSFQKISTIDKKIFKKKSKKPLDLHRAGLPVVNHLTFYLLNDMERFSNAKISIFFEKCKYFANYFHKKKEEQRWHNCCSSCSMQWLTEHTTAQVLIYDLHLTMNILLKLGRFAPSDGCSSIDDCWLRIGFSYELLVFI